MILNSTETRLAHVHEQITQQREQSRDDLQEFQDRIERLDKSLEQSNRSTGLANATMHESISSIAKSTHTTFLAPSPFSGPKLEIRNTFCGKIQKLHFLL